MKNQNISAYTEVGGYQSYPAYLSLNVVDGVITLSVRSRDANTVSAIELPPSVLAALQLDIERVRVAGLA